MAMAMQSGIGISKVLVIAGAGYTGTVLIKNGKLSDLIGELQLLVKGLEKSGDQAEGEGEYADAIAAQVRRLANEVRQLTSSRPITVLNGGSGQSSNLSSLVVPAAALGALGYGYMWWKGISFSDLMYVTKRNMEKAVADLTKKLQHASDVIADAKKHLTQRIQNLDDKMLKQNELARSIKDEVAGVRSTITNFHDDLGILQLTVETLDERLATLSWKQDYANHGLAYLIDFVHGKTRKMPDFLQQEQPKLSGKSPGLITYKGTPNLKGLKDIAETLSTGLDRSASDSITPDGMDKLEQQRRPLLRTTTTRC
ncbi:uncharacterized protein LOC113868712 isoform X2 [Abrus precatorius]|uniref:Uncharacterized protein LOC113868712 isoform X2 n=1 Tax=Abrus precatorius TaxID=3816 RepID=A0A8B8LZJ8_ABRPR|nr:uncharacterized protein LOC113868712 isoform X2 [Abrus precatorius]